ncbi:sugar phosphate isomerase/epimerase [Polaromonas sp. P1-6]|nr:sugar phosphate isomerase/epimerase [Polaromonas sp. P1-6]
MPRLLALHQITAMEAGPLDLVSIAAAVGCQQVCIFTHVPVAARLTSPFPVVTAQMKPQMLDRLREHHISVGNIEFFPVAEDVPVESYRAALALGAELGARRAVTHIHDLSDARAVQTLGQLADLVAEFGLTLGLEFMGLTPACNSLKRAAWFVEQVARPNAGIAVDALHLVRTGGTPADIAALPAHCYAYAQICDGRGLHVSADYLPEARDRMMPGEGDFPLQAIIEALPQATALDVEVPSVRLAQAGVSALERARAAVAKTRALIDSARLSR